MLGAGLAPLAKENPHETIRLRDRRRCRHRRREAADARGRDRPHLLDQGAEGHHRAHVAKKVGLSKEWVTAACLGQMAMTKDQAGTVGKVFGLPGEAVKLLQAVPYKGS